MKLIDKDAALAVIDKRINQIATGITEIPLTGREKADATLEREVLGKVRSLIDSLGVKEVDLEKEICNIWNPRFNLGWDEKSLLSVNHEGFTAIAKHFFELGLRASNQLTWEDIDLILDITDQIANDDSMEEKLNNMSQEEYCTEVLKRFKEQKEELL